MKTTLYSSASAAALLAASVLSVQAADIPSRKAAPAPVLPVAFTWTGFYVGVNAGAGVSQQKADPRALGNCDHDVCVGNDGQAAAPLSGSADNNGDTAMPFGVAKGQSIFGAVGGTIGYNHQFANNVVLGFEADFAKMAGGKGVSSSNASSYADTGYNFGCVSNNCSNWGNSSNSFKSQVGLNTLGTARLRAGYAVDRTLFFATGGLAFGSVKAKTSANYNYSASYHDNGYGGNDGASTGSSAWSGSRTKTRLGWTAGAGVEHAFNDHVTLKLDALYYNLGSVKTTATGSSTYSDSGYFNGGNTTQSYTVKHKVDGVIARVGLNFKF